MANVAKYSVTKAGNILRERKPIGTFSPDTGNYTLTVPLSGAATSAVKALIYDAMMEWLKYPRDSKIPSQVFPPEPILDLTQPPIPDPVVPDAPPCLPHLGDMTPAYMEWMRTWFPVDYERQYKGRITPTKPAIAVGGDVPESHFGRDPEEERR